ncbi:MAG: phosphoribosylformylglycinamidine synthase subunit PurS, partial [Candidatus Dormibacteraeota bacterium]|nr:phosphoribosylformylglycinamidine synthase subunit PurS [Candidatus Dormibacteraeota bacterium]
SLGFAGVREVRMGKYLEIQLEAKSDAEARSDVEQMCRKLLANRVIEDFRFDVDPAAVAEEAVEDAAGAGSGKGAKGRSGK